MEPAVEVGKEVADGAGVVVGGPEPNANDAPLDDGAVEAVDPKVNGATGVIALF
jgi:hypothetical protein